MKNRYKLLVLAFIVGLYFIPQVNQTINYIIFTFSHLNVGTIKAYILSFGVIGPIISFFLMVFQSVIAPLPAFLITFANASIWGFIPGALLSWSSAMAGAALCFYISKFFGRNLVEKLTSKYALEELDEFFERHGKYAILIARLLPFVSFDIVSYGAGLTSISFWHFFIATGIGQLPATLVYSYVGEMLTGSTKMIVMGLLILFAFSAFVVLLKRIYDDKKNRSKNLSENSAI